MLALPAIATAKIQSGLLCRWLDNKSHSYLLLQQRTVIREAIRVDRGTCIYRSLVRMPAQSCRLLTADWLAEKRARETQTLFDIVIFSKQHYGNMVKIFPNDFEKKDKKKGKKGEFLFFNGKEVGEEVISCFTPSQPLRLSQGVTHFVYTQYLLKNIYVLKIYVFRFKTNNKQKTLVRSG